MNARLVPALSALLLGLLSPLALAFCPPHLLESSDDVRLDAYSVFIVTHASAKFDPRQVSKAGIDQASSLMRESGIKQVFLQDDPEGEDYFTAECDPDHWVQSTSGEIRFDVQASHVLVAGGHLEQCLYNTVSDVLLSWSSQPRQNLTLTFLMDGIYSNGDLILESDVYHEKYQALMKNLTRNLEEDDPWPKLSLTETLGMMEEREQIVQYLTRTLPRFESPLLPDYQIELQYADTEPVIVQHGRNWNAPVLKFEFVRSELLRGMI